MTLYWLAGIVAVGGVELEGFHWPPWRFQCPFLGEFDGVLVVVHPVDADAADFLWAVGRQVMVWGLPWPRLDQRGSCCALDQQGSTPSPMALTVSSLEVWVAAEALEDAFLGGERVVNSGAFLENRRSWRRAPDCWA